LSVIDFFYILLIGVKNRLQLLFVARVVRNCQFEAPVLKPSAIMAHLLRCVVLRVKLRVQ